MTNLVPGQAFYSKALGKNVIYVGKLWGNDTFVGIGYNVTSQYNADEVGKLEPLVRECHYNAAVETAERFTDAVDKVYQRHVDECDRYSLGWADAAAEISRLAKPRTRSGVA